MSSTEASTRTLDVAGATLTYDIRRGGSAESLPLFLIGSPMAAAGFATLAGHFTDRTVVTYDPRGSERSTLDDSGSEATAEGHAEDVHRLIGEVGGGPVDLFASSGGAINALTLVAKHPEDIRTLVAHEPPLVGVLPDRDAARAASRAVHQTYLRSGFGAGMAHFIALASHKGLFTDDWAEQPAPDPASFGLPVEDDGSRDDPLLAQDPDLSTEPSLDVAAVRSASTRVVTAAGEESEGELTHRAALAVAERLGTGPVIFPSHHGGFLGGEYGQQGDPEAFAAKLRQVLTES